MAINLLDLINNQLSDSLLSKAANLVGESNAATKSAMGTILPTILASVVSKGSTRSGASNLLDTINNDGHDGSIFNNLSSLLGGGNGSTSLMKTGASLLSGIMGGRQDSILDKVISLTGLGKKSSSSLMSLVAPMVMGMIGKQVRKSNLGISGLMDLLSGQSSFLKSALPAGMNSILGFANSSTASSGSSSSHKTTVHTEKEPSGGGGWMKYLIPLLLVLGGIWAWSSGMFSSAAEKTGEVTSSAVDATGNAVTKAGEATTAAANKVVDGVSDAANSASETVSNATTTTGEATTTTTSDGTTTDRTDMSLDKLASYQVVDGNLVDASGKVIYKAGEFELAEGGYYVDKKGNKIGKVFKKIGQAVAGAADATADAFKNTFTKLFKKKDAAEGYILQNQIKWKDNSHRIDPAGFSKSEIEGLANALKSDPNAKIEVQAFTNDAGGKIKNKTLSGLRAKVVADMLTTLGVKAGQISSKGMGSKDDAKATANKVEIVVK